MVVSICAPSPASTRRAYPAGRQVLHGVDQMGEVAAEAGELPDHEHVALPQGSQAAVESRTVVPGSWSSLRWADVADAADGDGILRHRPARQDEPGG